MVEETQLGSGFFRSSLRAFSRHESPDDYFFSFGCHEPFCKQFANSAFDNLIRNYLIGYWLDSTRNSSGHGLKGNIIKMSKMYK